MKYSALLLTLLAAAPAIGVAQEPTPRIPVEFFKQRRQALMDRLKTGVVVLRGNGRQAAGLTGFTQKENFYYLTGLEQQNAALILFCDSGKDILLVEPFSRFTAQWEGVRVAPSENWAKKMLFTEIRAVTSLQRILEELWPDGEQENRPVCWTSVPGSRRGRSRRRSRNASNSSSEQTNKVRFERPRSDNDVFAANLKAMFKNVEFKGVTSHIHALRGVKQEVEIECIAAATRVACEGIAEAMKSTKPGVYEFQIAAAARYVFHRNGARPDAYSAIVGAGINGCVLHYSKNSKKTLESELVVMDYAPKVRGYASDVTRTFPTNGKFTPEQRKLVQDIYDVQQILIAMVKPGATLGNISSTCRQELSNRGYRTMHGPSHHVGLNVHDKGSNTLEPGMLITVEPGAYLRDKKMGCRIEDVILVTETGHVNLSGHLAAQPDDIEKLMAQRGIQQIPVGLEAPKKSDR